MNQREIAERPRLAGGLIAWSAAVFAAASSALQADMETALEASTAVRVDRLVDRFVTDLAADVVDAASEFDRDRHR